MLCPHCGCKAAEEKKFCGECGAPLLHRCPRCGTDNPSRFKFCGDCGSLLSDTPRSPGAGEPSREKAKPVERKERGNASLGGPLLLTPDKHLLPAERRQLSVMFCDLVGSTALSAQLDPEELREIVHLYQETCVQVISRYEGYLAQYLGDGVLVYFGYPVAHEDDAQRAIRAGLAIIEAMQELNSRLLHPVRVRIGVHTGLVVVGAMGNESRQQQLAIGETPNIAARLQALAAPETMVISAATASIVRGYFLCEDFGMHMLKGIPSAMQVYRVVRESGLRGRVQVARLSGLTPFVGRMAELGMLLQSWEHAKNGKGYVVLVSGEAGIGKSRLIQVLKERTPGGPPVRLECRCSPYHQHTALYPVIELLQRACGWGRDDSPATKLAKLEEALFPYQLPEDTVPLLAALLSLPTSDRSQSSSRAPQRQRQQTLEALLAVVLAVAARQPLLMVVEDIHWSDPSTLELLGLLLEQIPTARVLTIFTFRAEFHPPWPLHPYMTVLSLSRLGPQQVQEMIAKTPGGEGVPSALAQQVAARTDGVPLFVEELIKTIVELQPSVGATSSSLPIFSAIPSSLHDLLMARLDGLGAAKEVAQFAATLGREFSYAVLRAIAPIDEERLQPELQRLVDAELLYQNGVFPEVTYVFKHALIQEAAYQSLLKRTRQHYHQHIAQVLQIGFPEMRETQPELLAQHYTQADMPQAALDYWQRAGQRAAARSAYAEAVTHLQKGLEMVQCLTDTPERDRQELVLRLALAGPLTALKGHAAAVVEETYVQVRQLCRRLDDTAHLFSALFGLRGCYLVRGQLRQAQVLATQCVEVAGNTGDPALLVLAHMGLGHVHLNLGELALARVHLEEALSHYDSQQRYSALFAAPQDPGVSCLAYLAWLLWLLGYPDQALEKSYAALALARQKSHPFSLANALLFAAMVRQSRGEARETQAHAEELLVLSTEQGFSLSVLAGTFWRGWALTVQGQQEEGRTAMEKALRGRDSSRAALGQPGLLGLFAGVCKEGKQVDQGLSLITEALVLVDRNDERVAEAHLYQLKGELLFNAEHRTGNAE